MSTLEQFDETAAEPWLSDPLYGGLKPATARKLWEKAEARRALVLDQRPDEPPPVDSHDAFGIPFNAEPDLGPPTPTGGRVVAKLASRFKIEMLDDIVVADDPIDLVQGILPMGPALGVVFGPPKSLKSFLLNNIGMHIADNRAFCGRAVQGGGVIIVTSEGIRGVRRRMVAERRALGIEGRGIPFALVAAMPNLGAGPDDRVALQKEIAAAIIGLGVPLRLIVIDTMRRAMPGKSENEQRDVSVVVDNCEALSTAFGCLVILAHHSPRSDDERTCGSNALDAAADVMIGVRRKEGTTQATATVFRSKDGEEGDTWTFELAPQEIAVDRNGAPIKSCFVVVTIEPARKLTSKPANAPLPAAQQRFYEIILNASIEAGVPGLAGEAAPRTMRAITRETLKQYAKAAGWWDPDDEHSSRSKFSARLNELAGKHVIGLTGTHVWPAVGSASAQ